MKDQVSEDQFNQILAAQNMTYDEFRNDTIDLYVKDFIIFSLINDTVFSGINDSDFAIEPVTDQDIEDYFNENWSLFSLK